MRTYGRDSRWKTIRKFRLASDKRIMETSAELHPRELHERANQPATFPRVATKTQVLALRLLDAWIAGDRRRLDDELKCCAGLSDGTTEINDEREELLHYLAQQMMDEPDLFAPRNAKLHLGVWIDMLVHLAEGEPEIA
jgi:hypothetical protein